MSSDDEWVEVEDEDFDEEEDLDEEGGMFDGDGLFSQLARLIGQGRSQNEEPAASSDEEDDRITENGFGPAHNAKLAESDLVINIGRATGHNLPMSAVGSNIASILTAGRTLTRGLSRGERVAVSQRYVPSAQYIDPVELPEPAFCGTHSEDGTMFMSACQDSVLRLYDTSGNTISLKRTFPARDVGWAIVDTCYSPDRHFLIYSTWSNYIHLITLDGDRRERLQFHDNPMQHTCPFSVRFSQDSSQIVSGTNMATVFVYDCVRDEKTVDIEAHDDDVNAVAFLDKTSNLFLSGSDDCLCKLWDRRTFDDSNPQPVGVFKGHHHGVTFIDAMGDGTHFLSQGKDNCIKLWDIRKMCGPETRPPRGDRLDYRWQFGGAAQSQRRYAGDTSLMTYSQHRVARTLIRARFSPLHTTGQKYIYSGCAAGRIVIYDILTGNVVSSQRTHSAICRDVSWHPYNMSILSSGWDCCVRESRPMACVET